MPLWTRHTLTALALSLAVGLAVPLRAQEATPYTGYHVSAVAALPGKSPRWDHISVDPVNRRVFIGNRASGLTVVNIDTGATSTVAETAQTAGAAIAADLGLGLSDRGEAHDVVIFDLKTLGPNGHIKMATQLDGVFYDPASKMGYTNNAEAGSITFFDPVTRELGATVDLGSKKPEFSDVDGKGRAFIDLQDKNAIAVIDTKTQTLSATWPVECEAPTALMYEANSNRLFVPCRGADPQMAVVDAETGKTVARVAIAKGADAVAFNAREKLILVSHGSGTVQVIKQDSADSYHTVETVITRQGAHTLALDAKTGKAFVAASEQTQPVAKDGAKPERPKAVAGSLQLLTLDYGLVE